MSAADVVSTEDWIVAAAYVVGSLIVVFVLDRFLARRGRKLTQAVVRGELSQEVDTRLRFLRRLLYALIVLFGCALALAKFTNLNELAASFPEQDRAAFIGGNVRALFHL